jgi:hypothetical protein
MQLRRDPDEDEGMATGGGGGWPGLLALGLDQRTAENALLNYKVSGEPSPSARARARRTPRVLGF